jgi:hypothetical protein
VSAFGDVVQALIGSELGQAGGLDGSSPAPVPSVGSRPGTVAPARGWTAPDASGHGQMTVHRDVLRGVAGGMHSDLRDLDEAVRGLDGTRAGAGVSITGTAGLVAGWPTAVGFNANASAAFSGVVRASQQTGTAHQDTSSRLATTAATYDQSETDNLRATRSVGTNLSTVTDMVASYGRGGRASVASLGGLPSYAVKTHSVSGYSGAGMSAGQIMDILHGLSPGDVRAAGAAHTRLGSTLDRVAGRLAANARTLAENWTGGAAQAAMGQFQQLHDHMLTLAQQALQVGSVLSWLGGDVLPQFTSLPDPRVSPVAVVAGDALAGTVVGGIMAGPVGGTAGGLIGAAEGLLDEADKSAQAAADHAAQKYIAKLSGYLVIADQSLPSSIGAAPAGPAAGVTPAGRPKDVSIVRPAGSGGGPIAVSTASGTPAITTSGGTGGRSGGIAGTGGHALGTGAAGGTAGPPPSLQGATITSGPAAPPPGAPPTLSGPPPGPPGPGGGPLPGPLPGVRQATGPDLAGGPAGEELPGDPLPGSAGPLTGVAGDQPGAMPGLSGASGMSASDAPLASDVAGAQSQLEAGGSLIGADEATVSPGIGGYPLMGMGGAAGSREQDRHRQSWLTEDDKIWGLPANLVRPVIDAPPAVDAPSAADARPAADAPPHRALRAPARRPRGRRVFRGPDHES